MTVALVIGLSLLGCRPAPSDPPEPTTCQVEAGVSYAEQMTFIDDCASPPIPITPDVWYGPLGSDMVQVYPDFEGVYRFDLVSCETFYWHVQWIQGGQIFDSEAQYMAEPDADTGGVKINVLTPSEGCYEPPPDDMDPYSECVFSWVERGNEQSAAELFCCYQPQFIGTAACL